MTVCDSVILIVCAFEKKTNFRIVNYFNMIKIKSLKILGLEVPKYCTVIFRSKEENTLCCLIRLAHANNDKWALVYFLCTKASRLKFGTSKCMQILKKNYVLLSNCLTKYQCHISIEVILILQWFSLKGHCQVIRVTNAFAHGNGLEIKFKISTCSPEKYITYFLSVVCFNAPPLKLQRQHS